MFFTPLSCPANGGRSAKIITSPAEYSSMNAYSLSRLFIAWLTCLATLLFAPLLPAVEAEKAPPAAAEDNTLSIH
ncbi:lytic transglycosylase F, partial [Escherichia coli]